MAKARPFGFLDHNLRNGDSLLGIHNLHQLTELSLNLETKKNRSIFASSIETLVSEAIDIRKRLRKSKIYDIRDVQDMERLDKEARKKLQNVEHIADAMIGEALKSGRNVKSLEKAFDTISTWAFEFLQGDSEYGRKIMDTARQSLSIDLTEDKPPLKPFHWALEFPEVFESGGFNGIVGNPPYHHGSRVSTILGTMYLHYLLNTFPKTLGKGDLCTYFTRRAFDLINKKGCIGLVLTNSIVEGENLKASIIPIMDLGGTIYSAQTDIRWPGSASVVVTQLHITKSLYHGSRLLNGEYVGEISARLTPNVLLEPYELKKNTELCYKGSELLGDFYIDGSEAQSIIEANPGYKKVIRPFLGGRNFTSFSIIHPDRWVIFFGDMSLDKIENEYPSALKILKNRFFEGNGEPPKRKKWWQFHRHRSVIYKAMDNLSRVLLRPYTSNMSWFEFGEKSWVFSNAVVVVLSDDIKTWGVLNSSIHEEHTTTYATRMKTDLRYIPSSCFGYFPLADDSTSPVINDVAESYQPQRVSLMKEFDLSLRELYQLFHNAEKSSKDIQKLRDLHVNLDEAVAAVYGWDDLELGHGFHDTKQGIRFTISEDVRREVLQRLLVLNHERYKEEVRQGLHDKTNKKVKSDK